MASTATSSAANDPKSRTSRLRRVRVWFGRQVICTHDAEPAKARAFADAMTRRYAGLRVTIDGRTHRPGSELR